MRKLKSLILILLLVLPSHISFAKDLMTLDEGLNMFFASSSEFKEEILELTPEQVSLIESNARVYFSSGHSFTIHYYVSDLKKGGTGIAFHDVVHGKWGPIEYLLVITDQGKVINTKVLTYHEVRGKNVAKKRFLKQYKGKTIKDPIRLRKDIDGITGATISSTSMTDGIRKNLHIYNEIIKPKLELE